MISSVESSSLLKQNAPLSSRMEVNSGKSSHHSLFNPFTLKHHTRTSVKCKLSKQKRLQTGQVYSSHHSLRITLQFQRSIAEIVTVFIQFSHFNHFQRRHILNLTHGIITEGMMTHLQFFQSLTILQIEMTIRIRFRPPILIRREAILPNHHSLQLIQSNQLHFFHIHKTLITNLNTLQLWKL